MRRARTMTVAKGTVLPLRLEFSRVREVPRRRA
ncbi:hypothetical protein SAMN05216561_10352 [Nocardioides psychrotolerans]|uniref:Uncharacterized protein n=1 Tax=Nocardioides psychrotolerans TaxID=1005945 RepID=A0A1I3DS23_9ACTN|nr:hypothetical protein SAMN05216561_10352 [Nocardioides psychrotolerans]